MVRQHPGSIDLGQPGACGSGLDAIGASILTRRSCCHTSNSLAPAFALHASTHRDGLGIVFTGHTLHLERIVGAVSKAVSIKHMERAPVRIFSADQNPSGHDSFNTEQFRS